MGIWTQLEVDDIYPFTKNERELMKEIREVLKLDVYNPIILYRYGLYVNSVVADIKGLDRKLVTKLYNELPIKAKNEIQLTGFDIMKLLNKNSGKYLKSILADIEEKIINNELENDREVLAEYVLSFYSK